VRKRLSKHLWKFEYKTPTVVVAVASLFARFDVCTGISVSALLRSRFSQGVLLASVSPTTSPVRLTVGLTSWN